jgi:hypothetical protein
VQAQQCLFTKMWDRNHCSDPRWLISLGRDAERILQKTETFWFLGYLIHLQTNDILILPLSFHPAKKKKKSEIEANLKVKYWVERSFGNHLEWLKILRREMQNLKNKRVPF